MPITVEIPDETLQALRIPCAEIPGEVRKELALAFYRRGALSVGKASEIAGLSRRAFEALISERGLERPYDEAEIDHDLKLAREMR